MKNRDWLAHAAIFGWNSKNWLVSSSNFSTPQIFVENFWNKNGVHVGVFFFFVLFSSTTCTWKLRAALFLLCFATGLSQNETDLRAHDRNKKKPTKQRHLIVEPGSVSLAVLHKTGIRSHYIMLPFAEHTAQWFIHTWGCVFGPTWHACTNIIYRIKRF